MLDAQRDLDSPARSSGGATRIFDIDLGSLGSVADADLLAVILGGPTPSFSVRRRAAAVAATPLWQLRSLGIAGLAARHGLAASQAARVLALLGLSERWAADDRPTITSPRDLCLLLDDLRSLRTERVEVVLLDARYRFIERAIVAMGGINAARMVPADVLRPALASNAAAVAMAHNHPSGDPTPSRADRAVTAAMRTAASTIGVALIDHVIMARTGHFSFREAEAWDREAGSRLS